MKKPHHYPVSSERSTLESGHLRSDRSFAMCSRRYCSRSRSRSRGGARSSFPSRSPACKEDPPED